VSADEINRFMKEAFAHGQPPLCEQAERGFVRFRSPFRADSLRPGASISGPTMMSLADTAMYGLIFTEVGISPLAVTTNLTINFLSKPRAADLIAEARPLRFGKVNAVGEVSIFSDGAEALCAHAVVTYAVPRA
jgi:uncharacterized protein (TIGR00369 family)